MAAKKEFKPQNLRTLLAVLLALLVLGSSAAFYWGLGIVRNYATEVNQAVVDAEASGKQVDNLQKLKSKLSNSTALIDKANLLFSTPDTYRSQVLNDIENHADAAGVSLAATNFNDPTEEGVYSAVVTLKAPVSYSRLVTFLSNLESNLPKLQVSSLSLSRDSDNADSVKVGEIKIDIAVR